MDALEASYSIDRRTLANAIRVLAIDAVEAANSGHPGAPMGMADIAQVLWSDHLKHDPSDPRWPDRDRFILSNGHGSMLIYALLHLTGYDLPIEELKNFRQLHSRTPGHPEHGMTPGVETTTGPLGQGLANAVGMALAEKLLAADFNKAGHSIVDHRTWCFVGDGCLMEGISHEAGSFAGVLGLEKLAVFYDDNGISIDGHVKGWFADNTPARFEAYGWRVMRDVDGHDAAAVEAAIQEALTPCGKPTLICCKTVIGWGSPTMAGTHDVHGQALGLKEAAASKAALGWQAAAFDIPEPIAKAWSAKASGAAAHAAWKRKFAAYQAEYPYEASEFTRRVAGRLSEGFGAGVQAYLEKVAAADTPMATRKSSQATIEALAPLLPEFLGGSADLTGSNNTNWKAARDVRGASAGNYLHYGVREFGMAALLNGVALHGGYIPFGGTFLVFSDYARNALRLSSLMRQRVIFVLTHDSIGLGEDGPTHQPIEHVSSLRMIPGMDVWRPADSLETAVAWRAAVERADGPSCLVLTRQNLVQHPGDVSRADLAARGGYVLHDCGEAPDLVVIATGSEVDVAMKAADLLRGVAVRVVSMPSTTVFDRQDAAYRRSVLPEGIRRAAVEAGVSDFWRKYVGLEGVVVGIDRFGESAPASALFEMFGFTPEKVAAALAA